MHGYGLLGFELAEKLAAASLRLIEGGKGKAVSQRVANREAKLKATQDKALGKAPAEGQRLMTSKEIAMQNSAPVRQAPVKSNPKPAVVKPEATYVPGSGASGASQPTEREAQRMQKQVSKKQKVPAQSTAPARIERPAAAAAPAETGGLAPAEQVVTSPGGKLPAPAPAPAVDASTHNRSGGQKIYDSNAGMWENMSPAVRNTLIGTGLLGAGYGGYRMLRSDPQPQYPQYPQQAQYPMY